MKFAVAPLLLLLAACGSQEMAGWRSADPYERYLGALALSERRDAVDVNRAVTQLRDLEPLARDGAIVALGEIGDPEHAAAVAAALVPSAVNTEVVRADAVLALCRMKGEVAQAAVIKALAEDASMHVRRTAAHAVASFGPERPVLAALVAAMSDPRAPVAYAARKSLGAVANDPALPQDAAGCKAWLDRQPK
jgi:HEAT repeat protein